MAYFGSLLLLGYLSSRKESTEGFLIADRRLKGFTSGASVLASKVGGGTIIVLIAYIYAFGISAFTYVLGTILGYILFIIFSKRLKKQAEKKKYYTLMDYFRYRFGTKNLSWLTILLLFANLTNLLMQIVAGGKIIEYIFGLSYLFSVMLVIGFILTYLALGGFKAVVYTDILQALMFVGLLVVISIFMSSQVSTMGSFDVLSPALIIGFFIMGILLPFSSQELWQRVYATKTEHVRTSLWVGTIGFFIAGMLLLVLGIAIKSLLPGVDPDVAILEAFFRYLTGIFKVLGVVALFAIIMSSADTWFFNCTSIILQDLFRVKNAIRKHFVLTFVGLSILMFVLAVFLKTLVDIAFMYAVAYVIVGFIVVLDLVFKLKREKMSLTFIFSTILYVFLLIISGLDPTYMVVGILIAPVSYWLSGIVSFFKSKLFKEVFS